MVKPAWGMAMWKAILGPGRNAEFERVYNLGEDMTGSVCVCVEYSQPKGDSAENA